MSAESRPERPFATVVPERRRRIRWVAVAISGIVAILYAALFVIVRDLETGPDAAQLMDSTYGAYLFLAIAYVVSTLAYAVRDRHAVWLGGAVLQVAVMVLFVTIGVGVFDYELLLDAMPIWLWVGAITGLQVGLLALLGYLATPSTPAGPHGA